MRAARLTIVVAVAALGNMGMHSSMSLGAQERANETPRYSIEDFLRTTDLAGASWSPDKKRILVSSNQSGVFNVYAIPVDGGAPVQLTRSTTNATFALSYFPADERFLFARDSGGNELTHIHVRERDGRVRDLTPGAKLKANFLGWAHDDRSFFVATNERDPRFFDVYEVAVDGYARTLIYKNEQGYEFGAISPDKRYLAFEKPRTTSDSDIHLYDRKSGTLKHITPHQGTVQNSPAAFTPDGRGLLFTTDEGREFASLVRYDIASGERSMVVEREWDVTYAAYSRGGKYLVVATNEDARTTLELFEAATMRPVRLPALPAGNITSIAFSRDETMAAFYATDSRHPRDLFILAVKGGKPQRLTNSLNPAIDPAHLVDGRVVRFASYDGLAVPGLLYRPHQAQSGNKVPALVMVHGGPGGQARLGYSALVQYLVNHGYAVYDINNRGSSGYGKTFYGLDDRKHGDADLGDVVASKQMLIETGFVDPERVGIIGGSYGGYMVLAALAFRPDVFDAGVDIFGVANWPRTLRSIPPWWESFREALYTEMGDPETDSVRLHANSPLFHTERIVKPLIVLQGANDPRVLQVESDEIVAAVRKNGVPVEYIVFPDEGHGFLRNENKIRGYKAILDFLDVHLKGAKPGVM